MVYREDTLYIGNWGGGEAKWSTKSTKGIPGSERKDGTPCMFPSKRKEAGRRRAHSEVNNKGDIGLTLHIEKQKHRRKNPSSIVEDIFVQK
jgi:hypothetical protein